MNDFPHPSPLMRVVSGPRAGELSPTCSSDGWLWEVRRRAHNRTTSLWRSSDLDQWQHHGENVEVEPVAPEERRAMRFDFGPHRQRYRREATAAWTAALALPTRSEVALAAARVWGQWSRWGTRSSSRLHQRLEQALMEDHPEMFPPSDRPGVVPSWMESYPASDDVDAALAEGRAALTALVAAAVEAGAEFDRDGLPLTDDSGLWPELSIRMDDYLRTRSRMLDLRADADARRGGGRGYNDALESTFSKAGGIRRMLETRYSA